MNTNTTNAATIAQQRAELIEQFTAHLALIQEQGERHARPGVLRGENFVVRTSRGMYLAKSAKGEWFPTSIVKAIRWNAQDAQALATRSRNGAGEVGQVVDLGEALATEAATMRELIEALQAKQ